MVLEQKSFEKVGISLKIPGTDVVCAIPEGNRQPQLKRETRSVPEEQCFTFLGGIFNHLKAARKLH